MTRLTSDVKTEVSTFYHFFLVSDNYLDDGSETSEKTSNGMSLKRNNSFGRGARLGVAFDPTLGPEPGPDGSSKVGVVQWLYCASFADTRYVEVIVQELSLSRPTACQVPNSFQKGHEGSESEEGKEEEQVQTKRWTLDNNLPQEKLLSGGHHPLDKLQTFRPRLWRSEWRQETIWREFGRF